MTNVNCGHTSQAFLTVPVVTRVEGGPGGNDINMLGRAQEKLETLRRCFGRFIRPEVRL